MTTAATITGRMLLDKSDYDRKLDSAERRISSFQSKMQAIGSKLAKVGGLMTATITTPIVAIGTKMVNAASDLEESQNAVNVVFGTSSKIIEDYSKTAARSVGLAASQFNQLAAVTGSFLQNVGYDAAAASEQTIKLTERAADMASVFNTDVDQALAAIQSGLKGEFNPLEQFGVKINAAGIEAKAYAMHLEDANGELTDAAKAQAAMALIMEQTDRIAGDFANTSGGLANMSRILKARLMDLGAELGKVLLPYVQKAVEFINKLVEKFQALTPEQKKWIVMIGVAIAAIGPLVTIIGGIVSALGAAIGAISAPLLILIGVVVMFATAWKKNWGGIQEKTKKVWASIKLFGSKLIALLKDNLPKIIDKLRKVWENVLLPAMEKVWLWIWGNLIPLFSRVLVWIKEWLPGAISKLKSFWETVLLPAFQRVWQWIQTNLIPIFGAIWAWLQEKIPAAIETLKLFWEEKLKPAMETVWAWILENLVPIFGSVYAWLQEHIPAAIETAKTFWEEKLKPAMETVWAWIQENLVPAFQDIWTWLEENIPAAIETTKEAFSSMGTWFKEDLPAAVEEFKKAWDKYVQPPIDLYLATWDLVGSFVSYNIKLLSALFENVLLPPIKKVVGWLVEKFQPAIEKITGWLNNHLTPAFGGISEVIQDMIDLLHDWANFFDNLAIPDWLTPGSPTPFELGLRGINKEMEKLARDQLPTLNTNLNLNAQAPAAVGAGAGGSSVVIHPGAITINDPITGQKFIEMFKRMMNGDLG